MLNTKIMIANDEQKQQLMDWVEKIRKSSIEKRRATFETWKLCKEFDATNLWRLSGLSFGRFVKENCGIDSGAYAAYKVASDFIPHDDLVSVGEGTVKALAEFVTMADDERKGSVAKRLYDGVALRVRSFVAERGYLPSGSRQREIVVEEGSRMGMAQEKSPGSSLRERLGRIVSAMEQIASLECSDPKCIAHTLASGVLQREGFRAPKRDPLENDGAKRRHY